MINLNAVLELENAFNEKSLQWQLSGIKMETTEESKDSFKELKEGFKFSNIITVSTIGCDTSIFSKQANLNFRFWHDAIHLLLNKDFSLSGETSVISFQLNELKKMGLSNDALSLFNCDAQGQVEYYYMFKEFVTCQKEFINKNQHLYLV
jgi:hypothetical protein